MPTNGTTPVSRAARVIAASNNKVKITSARDKAAASQNGQLKPGELMRAIQNYTSKKLMTRKQAREEFRRAGFKVD